MHAPTTALQNHRDRFGEEDKADDEQQEFALEQNGDRAHRTAQRERTGVAHEHLRRMRVVPEESDTRANNGSAKDRQLTGAAQVEHLQVRAGIDTTDEIGEESERQHGDRDKACRESIQPISEIHRVARPGENESDEWHVQPRQ